MNLEVKIILDMLDRLITYVSNEVREVQSSIDNAYFRMDRFSVLEDKLNAVIKYIEKKEKNEKKNK